jgi:hypothetical protein
LQLRPDHWSEGAARVATRQGLQAKSFALAAESYREAVGGSMSPDSLRRVTEGWGEVVAGRRRTKRSEPVGRPWWAKARARGAWGKWPPLRRKQCVDGWRHGADSGGGLEGSESRGGV